MRQTLDESTSNLFKRTNIGSKGLQNTKKYRKHGLIQSARVISAFSFWQLQFPILFGKVHV